VSDTTAGRAVRLPEERGIGDLPPIPRYVTTPDGQRVDTAPETWVVRQHRDGGQILRLIVGDLYATEASVRAHHMGVLFLAGHLAAKKPRTCDNLARCFKRFGGYWETTHPGTPLDWAEVTLEDLHGFLRFGLATSDKGNDFSRIRSFYRWGAYVLEAPEFDKRLAMKLQSMTAIGNKKGEAVASWDPVKGPLTEDEVVLVLRALDAGVGTPEERITWMVLLELGLRPGELALLRGKHLKKTETKVVEAGGDPVTRTYYHLEVPKLKDRAGAADYWKLRPISERLGREIEAAGLALEEPIVSKVQNTGHAGAAALLRSFVRRADIVSPRTGELLHISSRRLRYTLATRVALEGGSRVQIAEILNHTDLQNVEVYIQAARQQMDQVDQALEDSDYKPVVERFAGRITDREDPEPVPGIPKRTIPGTSAQLPVLSQPVGSVGVCGRDVRADGLCKLAPPLSCYLCDQFVAFTDAPHGVIADRIEELVLFDHNSGADRRIPRQLLETLQAIRELEAQIAATKEGPDA
jgi:integrase